jgi:hypothetical protein
VADWYESNDLFGLSILNERSTVGQAPFYHAG